MSSARAPISAHDELTHHWGDDPHWQESVCAWFWDPSAAVGGWFRWGWHPNAGHGRVQLFAFDADGTRYRHVDQRAPIDPAPGGDLELAGCRASVDDGSPTFRWERPECAADLRFEGFHDPQGWGTSEGAAAIDAALNSGHLECSGQVRGNLRLGDRTVTVDALAHRDRSWGPRRLDAVVSHQMVSGTCGPELSFATTVVFLANGERVAAGFVARDGDISPVRDVEVLATWLADGVSLHHAETTVTLESGEVLEVDATPVSGQLTPWDHYLTTDHVSVARVGGRTGMCDVELTNNPRLGVADPPFVLRAAHGEGLEQP